MGDGSERERGQSRKLARHEALTLSQIDRTCRWPVGLLLVSAAAWLIVGSVLALLASIKMHTPGFLDGWAWLTFGRVRPAHLNTMIYGWASMAGMGVLLWLQARLCRVRLPLAWLLTATGVFWNVVVLAGTVAILGGHGTSVEWLEFPFRAAIFFSPVGGVIGLTPIFMFAGRRSEHIYISQWYCFGAVLWFPILYLAANLMIHKGWTTGVVQGSANWWFAHNVLGLWLTPIGLASAYYMIPKIIGRPIHSYYLSILGFWTLAIFYNWAGSHHLIGGPLPAWVITLGIVGSLGMFVPVITVAINHHLTMVGHFGELRRSPALRFIVYGAMCYTAVSVQGSLQALRTVNEVSHFTHYTVAHAHLGVYAFFTMIMFGCVYYIMPRLTGHEWSSRRLVLLHFWTSGIGMAIYWIGLTWGGWFQGIKMNDSNIPFMDVVRYTVPFLWSRSLAGTLMTIGHLIFAWLILDMLRRAWNARASRADLDDAPIRETTHTASPTHA